MQTASSTKRYHEWGRRVPRRDLRQRLTDRHVISAVCEPLFNYCHPIKV